MTELRLVRADGLVDNDDMKVHKSRRLRHSVLAGGALVVAFLFMASIFAPDRTEAGEDTLTAIPAPAPHSVAFMERSHDLGELQGRDYSVQIYATPNGTLYSIFDSRGREVASLLTPEEVSRQYPGLPLPGALADVPVTVMGTDVGGANP